MTPRWSTLLLLALLGCSGAVNPRAPTGAEADAASGADSYVDTTHDPEDADVDDRPDRELVLINEVLAHQSTEGYPDFVELLNLSSREIDLGGWQLDDDDSLLRERSFVFPAGTTIPPRGYLVVWCGADDPLPEGHNAVFGLGRNADEARLSDPSGLEVDRVAWDRDDADPGLFGRQESDISIGRLPDGGRTFAELDPTPGETNEAL